MPLGDKRFQTSSRDEGLSATLSWGSELLRVVRGAPTRIAGHSVGNLVPPAESAACSHSRRGQFAFLGRKRSSIKCSSDRVEGAYRTSASVTCAGGSLTASLARPSSSKASSALRRCVHVGIIESLSLNGSPSFKAEQETQGCREHAWCNQTEKAQPALGLSPNKSLQRSVPP